MLFLGTLPISSKLVCSLHKSLGCGGYALSFKRAQSIREKASGLVEVQVTLYKPRKPHPQSLQIGSMAAVLVPLNGTPKVGSRAVQDCTQYPTLRRNQIRTPSDGVALSEGGGLIVQLGKGTRNCVEGARVMVIAKYRGFATHLLTPRFASSRRRRKVSPSVCLRSLHARPASVVARFVPMILSAASSLSPYARSSAAVQAASCSCTG